MNHNLTEPQILELCKSEDGVIKYLRGWLDEFIGIGYYPFIICHPKENYPKILEMISEGKLEQGTTKGFFGVRFYYNDYKQMLNKFRA